MLSLSCVQKHVGGITVLECMLMKPPEATGPPGDLVGNYASSVPAITARYQHRMVGFGDKLWINGGDVSGVGVGDTYEYTISTKAVVAKAANPVGRAMHAMAMVGDIIYTSGGLYQGVATGDNRAFSTTANTWTGKTQHSGGRAYQACASDGQYVYVYGGNQAGGELLRYDPVSDTWATMATGPAGRLNAVMTALNGKLYLFGGSLFSGGTVVAELWVYDIAANTWTQKASASAGRTAGVIGAWNGKVYVYGGRISGVNTNTLIVYNPDTNSWSSLPPGGTAVFNAGGTIVNGRFYIFGGVDGSGNRTNVMQVIS